MKCGDCALYQTGACANYSAIDKDIVCDMFLSAKRYEEMTEQTGE